MCIFSADLPPVPDEATSPSQIVLPTYNERENLESILRDVLAQSPDFQVLVVDDGSPDGTGEIADRIAADPDTGGRVHVLHRQGKLGLGTAYIAGFHWALERGFEYVFEMDADYSHDPADLLRLREAVQFGRGDVAIGSRWVGSGGTRNWSFLRTFISRGGSLYARLILGLPIRDLTSGFKCFSRHVLETIDLDAVGSNGYAFQVEMNYRCVQAGFRVAEVPIVFVDRRVGKSKMGSNIVLEAMAVVLRLRFQPKRSQSSPARYSRIP